MTNLSSSKVSAWQMAADDILAACLNDHNCYEQARFGAAIDFTDFPPGLWRGVYRTICMLKDSQTPLHDSLIMEHVPGLDIPWLAQRMALDDSIRRAVFHENLSMLNGAGVSMPFMRPCGQRKRNCELRKPTWIQWLPASSRPPRKATVGRLDLKRRKRISTNLSSI